MTKQNGSHEQSKKFPKELYYTAEKIMNLAIYLRFIYT